MSDATGSPVFFLPPAAFVHHAMACTWGLVIAGDDARYARQAADAVFAEIDRLEQELSRFIPHSDISRLNAAPAGKPITVGIDAIECLEIAARVHNATDGAFDVALGAIMRRRESGDRLLGIVASETGDAMPAFGFSKLHVNRRQRVVWKDVCDLAVDLGGIGKGYGIDQCVAILREWSISDALLHSGQSTVYALGASPGEPGWRVSLRDPCEPVKSLLDITLRDAALSGSGVQSRGRHILDARTGQPAEGPAGAWALHESAAVADALSTALMVVGETAWPAIRGMFPTARAWLFSETSPDGPLIELIAPPIK